MISIFRWDPAAKRGTWVKVETLPEDSLRPADGVTWLDLEDPTEEEEALVFQKLLPVHPLTLEDIRRPRREPDDAPHLPKVEAFADYLFVIANPLQTLADGEIGVVQLSAIITERALITHHYPKLPAMADVQQFCTRHGPQTDRGPDYLFHLVLDRLVDEFAPEVDRIVERLDDVELGVVTAPSPQLMIDLVRLKRKVISLRKTLILMREVLSRLSRGEFDLVDEREIVYYRNVLDHLVRYTELVDGAREMVSDLMQTHIAASSNKLNSIMKLLAMVSTVILPMSLVASVYGMNFENLPEVKWTYGYPFALALMAAIGLFGVWIFYRRKWFD